MGKRIARDGGEVIELQIVKDTAGMPSASPKDVQLAFVDGVGFQYRLFGGALQNLGGGGGGGAGSDTTAVHDGGDTYGHDIVVQTDDAFDLILGAHGIQAWKILHATGELQGTKALDMVALGADPIAAAGSGKLYTKTVSGAAELFFLAGDGAVFQITSNTPLNPTDANAWHKAGDSFGADEVLGTMDGHSLFLYARGTNVVKIDDGSTAELVTIIGSSGKYANFRIDSHGGVGAGFAAYVWLTNTDGKIAELLLSDSGGGDAYNQKDGFVTLSGGNGIGVRINVNGVNNRGIEVDTTGDIILTGRNFSFANNPSTGGLGFFGAASAARQTVGANVNNVVASGTTGQFDDWTSLTTYATDAAAIHATVSQLCRSVAQLTAMARTYGLGG